MKLSYRLERLSQCVPQCAAAADIGSDHGLLPCRLLESGRIERAVIADISAASLQKAVKLLDVQGLAHRADFRTGNGLDVLLPGEVQAIVIAGMGGLEIIDILRRGAAAAADALLILQPMRSVRDLRLYLMSAGYAIRSDFVIKDGKKFYQIITARMGEDALILDEEHFGRTDIERGGAHYCAYLVAQAAKLQGLLKDVPEENAAYTAHTQLLELTKRQIQSLKERGLWQI